MSPSANKFSMRSVPKNVLLNCYHYATVTYMSHFSYACKTEGENGISCLISEMT